MLKLVKRQSTKRRSSRRKTRRWKESKKLCKKKSRFRKQLPRMFKCSSLSKSLKRLKRNHGYLEDGQQVTSSILSQMTYRIQRERKSPQFSKTFAEIFITF